MSEQRANPQTEPSKARRSHSLRQRPLLTFPQILALIAIGIAIYIGVDLNHRAGIGRQIEASELSLQEQLDYEATRKIELRVTRDYVNSEDYIADYAYNEAGLILPGQKRIVPLTSDSAPLPTPIPTATPDPAYNARSWQAWWRLFTDSPLPSR